MKNIKSISPFRNALMILSVMTGLMFWAGVSWGQTYYNMTLGNYSETFTAWSGYSTNWNGLPILSTGSIPIATKTTVATNGALGVVSSSTAIGYDIASSTKLVFLTTGTTDLTTAVAADLNLNFSGRTAGTVSFDLAEIDNSTGNRVSTLRLYYSMDGINWTELTGTNLPFIATNNVASTANVSIALPAILSNSSTVKFRFYSHNGTGGTTGSRPKISLDNVGVTSCATGTWLGTTDNDWHTPSNWCGGVPTSSTNVVIPSGGNQPTISAAAVCNNITINSGATLTIAGTNTLTVSGNWTNNGTFTANTSLVKFNSPTAQNVASGASSFYQVEHNGAGTMTLMSNPLTATNSFNNAAGTVDCNGENLTVGDLKGSGMLTNNSASPMIVNVGSDGVNTTFSGLIQNVGMLSLTKVGAGSLALTNANTYTGVTTFSGGILICNTLADGGSPSSIGQSTNAASNIILGNGILSYTGPTTTIDRNFTVSIFPNIDVASGMTLTISGGGTGIGILNKTGAGTLELTGSNTYTGGTFISTGTLKLNRPGGTTIPVTSVVTMSGSSTLQVSTDQTLNNLTLGAGVNLIVDSGATLTITGALNQAGGNISGAGIIAYGPAAKLVYGGAIPQTAGALEFPVINGPVNLEIANIVSATVTLPFTRTIPGFLMMTTGHLALGNNDLTVGSFNGGTLASHVITDGTGHLRATVQLATNYTFPVGITAGSYDPVQINPSAVSVQYGINVKVTTSAGDFTPAIYDFALAAPRQWDVDAPGAGTTTVKFTDGSATALVGSYVVGHSDLSTWQEFPAITHVGNTWEWSTSTFSPFGVGVAGAFLPPCIDPDVPTASATPSTICDGSSTTLSIATGMLNSATDWQWYTVSCGGTAAGSGTSIMVSPSMTTTYFVRGEGGCITPGACGSVTVTVEAVVDFGTVTSGDETICSGGDPADITLSSAPSGGAGTFDYQWYYQDGLVSCPSGTSTIGWTSIGGAMSDSYDPPSGLIGSRTYAVQVDPTGSPDCGVATWATGCRKVTVTDQEINVTGLGIDIADGDVTPDVADDTDFGSADIAGGMVTHTFTIENLGSDPLIVSSIVLSGSNPGDFSFTPLSPVSPVTTPATFDVTFDPALVGTRSATLSILNNDCDESIYDFAIQGTGTTLCAKVKNTDTNVDYCLLQDAINAATAGQHLLFLDNITEGIISINQNISIDGAGFTLTSTSPTFGMVPAVPSITIHDLTITGAGLYGIQTGCGADNLILTNVTVSGCGGTGISIYGSDNCTLTNITSNNNGGNGLDVTNCDNTTITGISTSGNMFMTGFSAGIGIFTSGTYCLPAGINGLVLGGTLAITEPVKVYSEKVNVADPITGLSGPSIQWAVGLGALVRTYWPDKVTAYAVVNTSFQAPYNYPNAQVYVAEVATENFYVDDDPAGSAIPMLIQTAVDLEVPNKIIFVEPGTYNETLVVNKSLTISGNNAAIDPCTGSRIAESIVTGTNTDGLISVDANNVVITGLKLVPVGTGGSGTSGIHIQSANTGLEVKNVIIDAVGSDRDGINTSHGTLAHLHNNKIINAFYGIGGGSDDASVPTSAVIEDNCIDNSRLGITGYHNGSTIRRNVVKDFTAAGPSAGISGQLLNSTVTQNTITNYPNGVGFAMTAYGSRPNTANTMITNNFVHGNGAGIYSDASATHVGVGVHDNDLSVNLSYSIYNLSGATLDATCNWYGVTGGSVAALVSGPVTYTPFLSTGSDDDSDPSNGFQPVPNSCNGCLGGTVQNISTGIFYCSIQDAINDPLTVSGNTIEVHPGVYDEAGQIVISKNLTITGTGIGCGDVEIHPTANTGSAGDARGWWLVQPGVTLNLNNLTLDGNGFLIFQGIRDRGLGTFDHICFKNMLYNPSTDYLGSAVAVFGAAPGSNVHITNSTFTNMGREGVLYFGTGVTGSNFTGNTYTGKGTGDFLDYGVEIGGGAVATIQNSTITNNLGIASSDGSGSAGILATTYFGAGTTATITNNFINNNTDGIDVGYDGSDVSDVEIHDNDLSGNTALAIFSTAPSVDATCNWYGFTDPGMVAAEISGPVSYTPWLTSGADLGGMMADGFQPSVACSAPCDLMVSTTAMPAGCPPAADGSATVSIDSGGSGTYSYAWSTIPVQTSDMATGLAPGMYTVTVTDANGCTATSEATVISGMAGGPVHRGGTDYCTIQAAIDDPATMSGATITVDPGTYNENINITKSITLSGANEDVSCTGIRGAESIISGSGGVAVTVSADGVTINGFTITNPLGSYGIYGKGRNNTDVQYNIITDIGNNTSGSNPSYGVSIEMGSAANIGNVNISNNCINTIRGGEDTSLTGIAAKNNNGSAAAIGAGFSTADFDISGLTINSNTINDITACTKDFGEGGKGAYGVLINVGASGAHAGKAVSPMVTSNDITILEGLWAHGIGLEGETPGAMVLNNDVNNLVDHKMNTDAIGVMIEDNDGAATLEIHDNSFITMSLAINNTMVPTVNAECNWYGVTNAAAVAASVSGPLNFTPWRISNADGPPPTGFHPTGGCVCTIMATATPTNTTCPLNTNGQVLAIVMMNAGPVTYLWSDGQISNPATGLAAGMYTVTVTDQNGCTTTASATVINSNTGPVHNVNTGLNYCTIQAAVNDPLTLSGHVINVDAGTYPENVTVNKSLTINGANAGIAGNGARGAESIVDGNNGTRPGFVITTTDVTIDGFKVQNCGSGLYESGIYTNSSGTMIINNILFNNEKGLYASNTGASTVQYNLFDGNNRPGPAGGVSLYSFTSNGLSVLNNEFKNQTTNAAVIFDGGASHSNLTFNLNYLHANDQASSCVYVANVTGGEFANNYITNGRRGFKIAGGDHTINMHNNIITGTAQADIMVNLDFGANTAIQAHNNSLTSAVTILNEDVTVVDATCNWFGSNAPAGSIVETTPNTVNYIPWLTSGTDIGSNPLDGFQPMAACTGTCNLVVSTTTTDANCPDRNDGTATVNVVSGGTGPYTYNWSGYVLGDLDGQNGWNGGNGGFTNYSPGDADVVNTTVHSGTQSWYFKKGYNSPGQGSPFSPVVASVGALANGASGNQSIIEFSFKAAALNDASRITVYEGSVNRDDRTGANIYVENMAGGLVQLYMFRSDDDGPMNDYSALENIGTYPANAWHTVKMVTDYPVTNSMDRTTWGTTKYYVDGVLTFTETTWTHWWRFNHGFAYTPGSSTKWTNNNAGAGFYIDDVSMIVNNTVSNTTIASFGAGFEPGGQSTQMISGLTAGTYNVVVTDLNGCTAAAAAIVSNSPAGPVHNSTTGLNYCTIQDAIDAPATVNGNIITVDAGTYAEDIIVNKSLTILGPNAVIDPCSATPRAPEAIVVPATAAIASGEIFHIAASDVTISGFTIDGDNTALASGFTSTNGADIDAAEGITVYENGINNLVVTNNIIQNLSYFGVTLYGQSGSATSGNVISNNRIQDMGTYDVSSGINLWGGGVLMYNNEYAAVTNNCMTNVRIGIQTGNYYQANPGLAASQMISGNTIEARRRGIFHNLAYTNASPLTFSNNTITGLAHAGETSVWDAALIASMGATASTFSGTVVNGSGVTSIPTIGIAVWNCQTAPLITGGTITGVGLGINVNNFESYPSSGSNAGNTSATIDGVSITNASIAGIRINDNASNTNNATVSAEIKGQTEVSGSPVGILVVGSDASANIHNNASTITGNIIGVDVDGSTSSLYQNNITANGTGVRVINSGNLTSATENFITNNTSDGIRVESNAGSIGPINSNDLSGNGAGAKDINNLSASVLSATCNWYGSNVPATVAGRVAGPMTYIPYLSSGADSDADPSNGFQPSVACACTVMATATPTPSSCPSNSDGQVTANVTMNVGTVTYLWSDSQTSNPAVGLANGTYTVTVTDANGCTTTASATVTGDNIGPVHNITTDINYCTIQAAIDASATMNGDTIMADAGTYNENVVITKSIFLWGANYGIGCASGSRVPESIISGVGGSGSVAVSINASNVSVNGFTITNPLGSFGVYSKGRSNVEVELNIITDIGNNTSGSGPSYGISIEMGSAANISDLALSDNCISDIRGGENTSLTGLAAKNNNGSASAIGAGFSVADFDVSNLAINANIIDNITACISDFPNGGKGAYGVLINVGANGGNAGKAVSPLVSYNEISNLDGLWSHGVGLEGETPGALVINNKVFNLVDHKMPSDAIGVMIEDNDGAATVGIHINSFTNMSFGVNNTMTPFVSAECNWYGETNLALVAAKISGNVNYTPYLTSGADASVAIGFQTNEACSACTVSAAITTAPAVFENTGGYTASVPDAGAGATYSWMVSSGMIAAGAGTNSITYTSGPAPSMDISVTVTALNGCTASGNVTVDVLSACQMMDFSSPLVLSNTQMTGAWYTDRYNPFGFAAQSVAPDATPNTLHVTIDASDSEIGRPPAFASSFYNTQGRKYDLIDGTQAIEADLYIDASWAATGRRMAGMWGTGFDVSNAVSAFPIVEFTSDGGVPRFRGWESGTGVWVDMGLPAGFIYDSWVRLRTQLLPSGEFTYTVVTAQGTLQFTTTTSAPDATTDIGNVILQGHNTATGVTYDVYWDNFKSTTILTPVITPTPSPVCALSTGNAASVTMYGGAAYAWSIDGGMITGGAGTSSITYTAGSGTEVTLHVTVTTTACEATTSLNVPVNPLPVVSGPSSICTGYTAQYLPSTGGTWMSSNNAIATIDNAGLALGVGNGLVTFTFTNTATGCSSTTGNVNVMPTPSAVITANMNVYQGSINNIVSVPNAGLGATYLWSVSPGSTITSGAGTNSIIYTAGNAPSLTINVTVTSTNGCSATGTKVVNVLAPGVSTLMWVPDNTGDLSCGVRTDCCKDTLCFNLKYTPGVSGDLTTYTTGFFGNCLGGPTPPIGWNNSCVMMTNNPVVFNQCMAIDSFLFNSSGNNGVIPITQGVPLILHKVCFNVSTNETLELREDMITNLSTSVDQAGGGQISEYPGYTTTTFTKPAPVMPANGAATVECPAMAGPPTFPTVMDACGNVIPMDSIKLISTINTPDPITCEGTRVYHYTYTDCSGYTQPWQFTYTIDHVTIPFVFTPVPVSATVQCFSDAVPPTLPVIHDVCQNVLSPVAGPVITGTAHSNADCTGTVVYTYLYTDCSNLSTTWTFTYNLMHTSFPVEFGGPAPTTSTVQCYSDAVEPVPPVFHDVCGNHVDPGQPVITGTATSNMSCTGTVTYTFPFTDCAGLTTFWGYTYNLQHTTPPSQFGGPVSVSGTVQCYSDAVPPTLPVFHDVCGNVVMPTLPPVVTGTAVSNASCNGTVIYTYTYTDCATLSSTWVYTYTLQHTSSPTEFGGPASTSATVQCYSMAVPPALPVFHDVCGNVVPVTAGPVISGSATSNANCSGDVVYTYTFTDCAGLSTNWVFTYTLLHTDGPTEFGGPASTSGTVQCWSNAVPPALPVFHDVCGNNVPAGIAAISGTADANDDCSGTVIYDYPFTDCAGLTTHWIYTYTLLHTTPPSQFGGPVSVASTVQCFSDAVPPTLPVFHDVCGNVVMPTLPPVITGTAVSNASCNGTVIYTYTYTDCALLSSTWVYTYTLMHTTPPSESGGPASTSSTVQCFSNAVPPVLPVFHDVCGNVVPVTAGPVISGSATSNASCSGDVIYTYTFTDCAGLTSTWTYTYTLLHTTPPAESGGPVPTAGTVQCWSDAVPPALPVFHDVCGNVVPPAGSPAISGTAVSNVNCTGTVIYTYTYTDCALLSSTWIYTYTLLHTTPPSQIGGPVPTTSTVDCGVSATPPAVLPVVSDVCGNILSAPVPVISGTYTTCEGTLIYTYTYADCQGLTYVWVYTYTIDRPTFANPMDAGSVVECPLDANVEPPHPTIIDACGQTLVPIGPVVSPNLGCGTTRTYTWTYIDCSGNIQDYVYTYTIDCFPLKLKVMLEGPFNTGTSMMNPTLNVNHVLPGQDKTLSPNMSVQLLAPYTPFGQPYNIAPWNYSGNSGAQYGDPSSPGAPPMVTPYPADVVDWVLVTVRKNGILPANNYWSCAGWVHTDGQVTFPDPCGGLVLTPGDNYYVLVQHRTHLGVLSPSVATYSCGGMIINWDFTTSNSYAPIFRYGQKEVAPGIWAMHAANGEQTTSIAAISSSDRTTWRAFQNTYGYSIGDYNMSAFTESAGDETLWKINQNRTSGIIFY